MNRLLNRGKRKNGTHDLKGIARHVVDRTLRPKREWRPTTQAIQDYYDLDEAQAGQVKRHAKQYAAELGVLWGYDPGTRTDKGGYFRPCPANRPDIAVRMLTYGVQKWASEGTGLLSQFEGALLQGYVSMTEFERMRKRVKQAYRAKDEIDADVYATVA